MKMLSQHIVQGSLSGLQELRLSLRKRLPLQSVGDMEYQIQYYV